MKKKIAILAAILCVIVLGVVGVTWATDDMPTVIFDASAKTFSFQNCTRYSYGDENGDGVAEQYPDLFPSEDGQYRVFMPGDSFERTIRVRVINAGSDTVKMYLRSENPNADYDTLFGGDHPATLSATFGEVGAGKTNILTQAKDFIRGKKDVTITSRDTNMVYLGAFTGSSRDREVDVTFALPLEAGNEYAGLTAMVDWVFLAEIISADPGPGPGPTPPTPPTPTTPPEKPINPHKPSSEIADWNIDLMEYHAAYIIGSDDGLVHPEASITRAEIATIFFRLMTTECRERYWSETNTFTDVPSNAWYNTAVSTLANAGVLKGYPDGRFGANDPITRAEFVTIVHRIVSAKDPQPNTFTDTEGHWASAAIDSAQTIGLLSGYPDGTFRPANTISRAEAIAICNRVLGRAPDIKYLLDDMIQWPDNQDPNAWYYLEIQEATNTHMHGYDEKNYGNREYWIQLEMNIDWKTIESPDYAGTHEIYSSSIDNKYGE